MTIRKIQQFQEKIWDFYKTNKRDFPWRETTDPYKILVSEVMLQQTQTSRVILKYQEFLEKFPSIQDLAKASNAEVLSVWSGLGYNRRALYLKKSAEILSHTRCETEVAHRDSFEWLKPEILQKLPGIGPNTAGSIYVFSTNKPHVFIETNIRRVFIHEFKTLKESQSSETLTKEDKIDDKELLPLISQSLPKKDFRNWYFALMDYGAYLAKSEINPNRKSKHYTKQSKFEGSVRQTRGKILKLLLPEKSMDKEKLEIQINSKHFKNALEELEKEGFVRILKNKHVQIS